ncbi:MAG: sigma-70 family RNA polymerase sigma factor [Myxococcota bacterium]
MRSSVVPREPLRVLPGGAAGPSWDLGELYREHAGFVWRLARHLGAPSADLDDIVHDAFLIAHRRRHDFDPSRPPRNWLFGITNNLVMRARTGQRRAASRLRPVPSDDMPGDQPGADEIVQRAEGYALLEGFLTTLPAPQRDVFVLHDLESMSAPQVADTLGVKLNTVYSRLRLARKRFGRFATRLGATDRRPS